MLGQISGQPDTEFNIRISGIQYRTPYIVKDRYPAVVLSNISGWPNTKFHIYTIIHAVHTSNSYTLHIYINNTITGNNNNNPANTPSSLLTPTQFGVSSYGGGSAANASSASSLPSWGGAPPTQSSHQWQQQQQQQQQNQHYQPPAQYGQSQFGGGAVSNFGPNGQFGAPTSNAGFLPR